MLSRARGTKSALNMSNTAPAVRQTLIGKAGGSSLVYVNQVEPFSLYPPEEMAGAVGVAVDGVPRMPALDQVSPECLNVWRLLRVAGDSRTTLNTICRSSWPP